MKRMWRIFTRVNLIAFQWFSREKGERWKRCVERVNAFVCFDGMMSGYLIDVVD